AEVLRQQLRGAISHMPHPQRGDEAREWNALALRDRLLQLLRRSLCEAFERQQLFLGDAEQVRGLSDEPVIDELFDDRGTEAFDVQRTARREMEQALDPLRGT